MTYIAIMSAITVVLSVLTNFFPLSSIFLIIFLPFVSALVAIICDIKLFPVYLVSSILLSIIIDMPNFLNIIFYLLPAMISGFVIGLTYRLKVNGIYILILVAITNLLSNFMVIPVLDNLYEINFINYALGLIGLGNHYYANALFMLFLFVVGLIQAAITYMIVNEELYIIKGSLKEGYAFNSNYVMLVLCAGVALFVFIHVGIALVLLSTLVVFTIYQLMYQRTVSSRLFYFSIGAVIIGTFLAFIISEIHSLSFLPLYLILPVLFVVIINFLWEYILKQRSING